MLKLSATETIVPVKTVTTGSGERARVVARQQIGSVDDRRKLLRAVA
ncbi:MAG TPA: hypothetical protein VNN73_07425 [Blastocatellia bacterium]|nr:hypothetical protein [Blastocatellia bacterium]